MGVRRVSPAQTDQGKIREKFPGNLVELWGLTEGVATTLKPEDMTGEKTGSIGIPLAGWHAGIIDDKGNRQEPGNPGEIVAFSSFLMPEYYKLPEKTKEAMWLDENGRTFLKTGDMGVMDREGLLYIRKRPTNPIFPGDAECEIKISSRISGDSTNTGTSPGYFREAIPAAFRSMLMGRSLG